MRMLLVLLVLSVAATSLADDPLETLNTVEDTVTTMQHTLKEQAEQGDAEPSGANDAAARPDDSASVPPDTGDNESTH